MKTFLLKEKINNLNVLQDSQFVLLVEKEATYEVNLNFKKEGVSAELLCVYVLNNNKKLKISTLSHHQVSNTSCNVIVKGVLKDSSSSDFFGKIIIDKKANNTNSYLHDDILNIGEHTQNTSQPVLQIDANDVKASHGATTGRVSDEYLYYLQSRGLTKSQSEEVIISGFTNSITQKIIDPKIRVVVERNVQS